MDMLKLGSPQPTYTAPLLETVPDTSDDKPADGRALVRNAQHPRKCHNLRQLYSQLAMLYLWLLEEPPYHGTITRQIRF